MPDRPIAPAVAGPRTVPQSVLLALACPQCAASLIRADGAFRCTGCDTVFDDSPHGAIDLRLRKPKRYALDVQLGRDLLHGDFEFAPLRANPTPEVDYSGVEIPRHLTKELLTYFPRARSPQSIALDLGCGTGLHREVCERAGFQWAGVDYADPMAPVLADGHALPFRSESIEVVVSIAVLEHIRFPAVLAREVLRVLKPGAYYIGTVSFLEPFHGDSYYHHTHLGTYNTLDSAGFEVLRVAPKAEWSGLRAQATMGLFPKLSERLATALVWPLENLHKLWWRVGRAFNPKAKESVRVLATTGAFEFVARKPK